MKPNERDYEFLRLYTEEGKTLQEIGDMYGLTRERVRQRLRVVDPEKSLGGKSLQVVFRKIHEEKKISNREIKCLEYFGCSIEFRDSHGKPNVKGTLSHQFLTQKNNAKKRKIPFLLTFPEWLQIWNESGHLNDRGLGRGKYHMTRVCDSGPYSIDNVEIKPHEENSKEARLMDKVYKRGNRGNVHLFNGVEYTLSELAFKYGIRHGTLQARLDRGWNLDEALNTPVMEWRRAA